MYLLRLHVYILLGSVLVYSKLTVKEVEVTGHGYNAIHSNGDFDGKKVHSNAKGSINPSIMIQTQLKVGRNR
jgi:hypothetical protein